MGGHLPDGLEGTDSEDGSDERRPEQRRPRRRSPRAATVGIGVLLLVIAGVVAFASHDRGDTVLAVAISPTDAVSPEATRAHSAPPASSTHSPSVAPTVSSVPSKPVSSAPPSSASPSAAACTAAQLKLSAPQPDPGGMSKVGQVFTITNTDSQPCALTDHVTNVHGRTTDGTPNALSQLAQGDDPYFETTVVPDLVAGGHATFEFIEGAPSVCARPQSKVTIASITFSIGPDAIFTADLASDPMPLACGYGVTKLGVPDPNLKSPPKPNYQIQVTRTVPSRIVAGQQMDYTITVTNTGPSARSLSPCPTYTAFLAAYPGDDRHQVTGQLHCGGHTSIPAGGSITFKLSVPVPAEPGVTALKFGWTANSPSNIAHHDTGALIRVTN